MAGTRGRTEAAEEYLGATPAFSVDDIGVNPGDIEIVDRVLTSDKAETELFMAEKILVIVQDSADETDHEIVESWVNGRVQRFLRGQAQLVKRCYVEALARAKRTTYRQTLDERYGEQSFNQMRPHHSLAYPFTVLEDRNPKGKAWLQSVLAHAQRG